MTFFGGKKGGRIVFFTGKSYLNFLKKPIFGSENHYSRKRRLSGVCWHMIHTKITLSSFHERTGPSFLEKQTRGARSFFRYKKGGRRVFFEVKKGGENFFLEKKRGAKSFFWQKKGGLRLFLPVQNPQNPARVPYKFWSVPKLRKEIITFASPPAPIL